MQLGHGPALSVLSLPVLLFLYEGFKQSDMDYTRKCALDGFAKGVLMGPPLLGVAELFGGVLLAILCFGKSAFERIVNAATVSPSTSSSFSVRLFREACQHDPWRATLFALLSCVLVVGLCEEVFKMGIGAWQMVKFRQHKNTLNPVVVMAAVGLGLAYSESLLAVSSLSGTSATMVASERVLTSFPIHVFCAVWTAKRGSNLSSWFLALLPAALAHGLYDFGLIQCVFYSNRFTSLTWSFATASLTSLVGSRA